ncbi:MULTISPECIES: hypothetical protein [unclassified Streptomyces]|uniref:hypothetical protein n=1 Tax=unclassified Streptomyces TaxID=2593676 RepID=UPI0033FC6564
MTGTTTTEQRPEPAAADHPVVPAPPATAPRARSPRWRSVALWAAAALVCGGAGTGTALGITGLERTDVPGLGTASDGRWDYPELSLPALPVGVQRPFTEGNLGEVHHADLRDLVLPAPRGAEPDEALDGGFVPVDRYLAEFQEDEREELRQKLLDLGLRHVAARGWAMPDGTRTRVYLLRFPSVGHADTFRSDGLVTGAALGARLADGPESELDVDYDATRKVTGTTTLVYQEPKPHGQEQLRHGHVLAGDTLALVVHARKGGVPAVPFHQSVVLQNQLLG